MKFIARRKRRQNGKIGAIKFKALYSEWESYVVRHKFSVGRMFCREFRGHLRLFFIKNITHKHNSTQFPLGLRRTNERRFIAIEFAIMIFWNTDFMLSTMMQSESDWFLGDFGSIQRRKDLFSKQMKLERNLKWFEISIIFIPSVPSNLHDFILCFVLAPLFCLLRKIRFSGAAKKFYFNLLSIPELFRV